MQMHEIRSPYKRKARKKIGRGGKRGTYSGKGQKGQRARTGHRIRPAHRDVLSRLPKLRGTKNKSLNVKAVPVSLEALEKKLLSNEVNPETLKSAGIIRDPKRRVKIVGDGDLKRALQFSRVSVSKAAKEKIEKAGGSVL